MQNGALGRDTARIGIVVIGRNEASNLPQTLTAAVSAGCPLVYVDSASVDDSVAIARGFNIACVELSNGPHSAARARQSGVLRILELEPRVECVQFIDGDCQLHPQWLETAQAITEDASIGAVAGRLWEEDASRSILHAVIASGWELPCGEVDVIGGNCLIRCAALFAVGGWSAEFIAGEELDLSVRLRRGGWRLVRVDAPMCSHKAAISNCRQLWRRELRTGYAYCMLVIRHRKSGPWRWTSRAVGSVCYGGVLPLGGLVALALFPELAFIATALYASLPVRLICQHIRRGEGLQRAVCIALLMTVLKSASAVGVAKCAVDHLIRRRPRLIEYKAAIR